MIARTSDEAYEEYQKLRQLEEKLDRGNRGLNVFNADKFFKPNEFFIEVRKEVELTLIENSFKFVVNTDFPFSDFEYGYRNNIKDFLKRLKKWVSIPRYNFFVQHNRRIENKSSWYSLPKFRNFDVQFKEIEIKIGKEAQHELNLMSFDFVKEVEKLLSQQREATEKESKDFERFKFLLEELGNLKRQLHETSRYDYYNESRDKTLEIKIDKRSYNEKLNKVGQELKKLCKKYSFLEMPRIEYKELNKMLSFENWKAENKVEAEDNWTSYDDDEKEEYDGNFESYLKYCYENYLEMNDFDE